MKNSKKEILRARFEGNEVLAKLLELENKLEDSENKKSDNTDLIEVLCAMDQSIGEIRNKEVPAPIVNVEKDELIIPDSIKVNNLNDIPQPKIHTDKVEFPKEIKEIPRAFKEFAKYLKQKAKDILKVKVVNDFIGVRFLRKTNSGKYQEVEPEDIFNVTVAGGGGPSNVGIKDSEDDRINPSTEEKQDDIISELSAVADTPEFFEDTSFVTGDSPVTLDINAALGRNATEGYIINDGDGNFTVAFSTDGSAFGDAITMKKNEVINFKDLSVDSLKIIWVSDSAYRISVV